LITIVSGLPRSGTSLMMQMLAAGGVAVLTDGERTPDTDNPRGYYEWERIKLLPKEPHCIAEAEGQVVKVISQLLLALPGGHEYRVIFMQRPLAEVLASQEEMIRRRGTSSQKLGPATMMAAFRNHLHQVNAWLEGNPNVSVCRVDYHQVLHAPRQVAESVQAFLGYPLDVDAMSRQVDRSLYRNRSA
jgi:hypothetical protein